MQSQQGLASHCVSCGSGIEDAGRRVYQASLEMLGQWSLNKPALSPNKMRYAWSLAYLGLSTLELRNTIS